MSVHIANFIHSELDMYVVGKDVILNSTRT